MIPNNFADKDYQAASGNVKLKITAQDDGTTFRWTYQCNGFEAPDKCIALRYENECLKYFLDNWNLYNIGSTEVNLSEQEAIDIAMAAARNYSPDSSDGGTIFGMKFTVTNAMIYEKVFAPSIYVDADKARRGISCVRHQGRG